MLKQLYIKNYVIIDEISISFDQHLNVITGETGAGKSIILGAISLILGERAESSVLINKEEKCIVEAQFDTRNNTDFEQLLKTNDLDSEYPTLIRREISTSGKSRAFINDTPVTLSVLNSLTACLVDLHRQFDNRALDESRFMFQSLDAIAGIQSQVKNYQTEFEQFKKIQKEFTLLNQQQAQWQKEADYNNFLFEELETANFQENEIEQLEQQMQQLGNAELIQNSLSEAHHLLAENELAIVSQVRKIGQNLQQIGKFLNNADELAIRLNSCYEELKDIAHECEQLKEEVELDPGQLVQLQERYDIGNRLLKKHAVTTTNELRTIHEKLATWQLQHLNADTNLAAIKDKLAQQENLLAKLSEEIATNRQKAAPQFAAAINKLLHLVGMPNAVFNLSLQETIQFNNFGKQDIQFLLDANKSGKMQLVQKAASGGELSRIMLSIKTLTAKALHMPTLIFDEVDTGISGEAAKQVGILLRSLGEYHQILCITHQPQVAGKGHRHLYVYKTNDAAQVNTRIKELTLEERIQLIASMIGGAEPSAAAINNAKELVTA